MILYTTLGCHLCEQAQSIVVSVLGQNADVTLVDIASDETLIERYGVRIPVLKDEVSGAELGWPFNAETFIHWQSSLPAKP